jgi:hypothetical protein
MTSQCSVMDSQAIISRLEDIPCTRQWNKDLDSACDTYWINCSLLLKVLSDESKCFSLYTSVCVLLLKSVMKWIYSFTRVERLPVSLDIAHFSLSLLAGVGSNRSGFIKPPSNLRPTAAPKELFTLALVRQRHIAPQVCNYAGTARWYFVRSSHWDIRFHWNLISYWI